MYVVGRTEMKPGYLVGGGGSCLWKLDLRGCQAGFWRMASLEYVCQRWSMRHK